MKVKKIISLFLAIFILLVGISPNVYALENPTYTFLEGWQPMWQDVEYDWSFNDGTGQFLNLKGTLYAKYNSAVQNFAPDNVLLQKEKSYHSLSGWNGVIFVETKKLKPWMNKIMWADYNAYHDVKYVTNKDTSLFGIIITCWQNDLCSMSIYGWNDYSFPDNYYYGNTKLRWVTVNNWQMVLVKDFVINRSTDPDFMIYSTIEVSKKYNDQTQINESRLKMSVDVETKPWSGIIRKPTETTRLTAIWPWTIWYSHFYFTDYNFLELKFLNYLNVYSIDRNLIKKDVDKIHNFVQSSPNEELKQNPMIYEAYFRNMQLNMFWYLFEHWFKQMRSTDKDLEDAGINTNSDIFNLTELKEWQTDFAFQECENFQILCHIKNAVWYLVYKIWQIFSAIFNPLISVIKNIWNWFADVVKGIFTWLFESIKNFPPIKWLIDTFHPMLVILWDYFMSYFTPIWDIFTGKTNLQDITWWDQEYICSKEPSNFIMESTTPAGKKPMEALWAFIYFINPLPPLEWAEICTGLWMKRIEYGKNTILDVFLFNIFVFAGIWFAFIWLRRYN